MKKVLIMSPDNASDKAYREQKILTELGALQEAGKCFGFVTMLLHGVSEGDYVEIVMQKGGDTLHNIKTSETMLHFRFFSALTFLFA